MGKISLIQSNYLTSARYDYDVVEKRIIYHILLRLKNDLFNGISQVDLGKDMDIVVPESQLRRTDSNDNYLRDYRRAVKKLREKSFSIDLPEGGWVETGFILRGQYRKGSGLELTVSRDILGFLYDLSRGFTAMDATVAITLHSKYAQRFYEWCCRWRDKDRFTYTPNELREVLGLTQPTKWVKQFVLDVAERGIKEMYDAGIADLYFTYEEKRGGRGRGGTVLRWNFIIHNRHKQEEKLKAKNEDFTYVINTLQNIYDGNLPLSEGILAAVSIDHETLKDFAGRLASIYKRHQKKPIRNIGGYVRTVARDEYGFEDNDPTLKEALPSSPKRIGDLFDTDRYSQ